MRSLKIGKSLLHWLANIDEDGIAWLHLKTDGKSVNVLNHAVMVELESILDRLESKEDLNGVAMLSGKQGGFVYGADIHEFETLKLLVKLPITCCMCMGCSTALRRFRCQVVLALMGLPLVVDWKLL